MPPKSSIKSKLALNLSSTLLPLIIGVASIPSIVEGIGVERFGLLSIAWMLVGYFSLLDMGLGRALTQKVAQKLGANETNDLKSLIIITCITIGAIGALLGILLLVSVEPFVQGTHKISPELKEEFIGGVYWIALSIPFVTITTGLLGVLEGQQSFGLTAIVRGPMGALTFASPLIVLQWTPSLTSIFLSILMIRTLFFLISFSMVIKTTRNYEFKTANKNDIKSLISFGGWLTLSNIISPAMVFFDRLYIATALPASVIAYYTTPADILIKALTIPIAIMGVMFSSFSRDWNSNTARALSRYQRSIQLIAFIMLPLAGAIFFFSDDALSLWLGLDFSEKSSPIAKIFAIAIFFNSLATAPYALIQAAGRADITAKLHLIELPVYATMLFFLVEAFGLHGAAYAWAARVTLDAALLYYCSALVIKGKIQLKNSLQTKAHE